MPRFLCWHPYCDPKDGQIVLGYDAEDAAEDYMKDLYNHEPYEWREGGEVFTRRVLTDEPQTLSDLTQAWKVEIEDWTPHFVAEPA